MGDCLSYCGQRAKGKLKRLKKGVVAGISKVDSCSEQKWNIRVASKSGKMGDVGVD
jgi:hypothetical protein